MDPYDKCKQVFTQELDKGKEWVVWIGPERWLICHFHDHYRVEKNHDCLATPDTLEQAVFFFLDQIGFIKE